jgi:hypothetical protein
LFWPKEKPRDAFLVVGVGERGNVKRQNRFRVLNVVVGPRKLRPGRGEMFNDQANIISFISKAAAQGTVATSGSCLSVALSLLEIVSHWVVLCNVDMSVHSHLGCKIWVKGHVRTSSCKGNVIQGGLRHIINVWSSALCVLRNDVSFSLTCATPTLTNIQSFTTT